MLRCSIFRQKREQRSSHVQARNTRFYSSPSATIRVPCVLQIRAGIMEFTCNSALSAAHRTRFPEGTAECSPYGDFATRVSKYVSSVAHLRDFTAIRLGRHSRFLRSSHWLLNVRQVIYTRGFTAREILRKALTRTETSVVRRESVTRRYAFRERKIIFYSRLRAASCDEWYCRR